MTLPPTASPAPATTQQPAEALQVTCGGHGRREARVGALTAVATQPLQYGPARQARLRDTRAVATDGEVNLMRRCAFHS
jgi:hypothetical protein